MTFLCGGGRDEFCFGEAVVVADAWLFGAAFAVGSIVDRSVAADRGRLDGIEGANAERLRFFDANGCNTFFSIDTQVPKEGKYSPSPTGPVKTSS